MRGDVAPPAHGICMKTERVDTSKLRRYIMRNFLHFLQKHAILPASKERLRGGRRGGRGKSVPAAAGREPAAGQTKQFIYQHYQHVQQQLSIPGQTAARKTDGREPFPLSPFAARRGPDGPGPIPAPARTPAVEGGDAYDCPQIEKLLQIVSAHSHRLMAMLTRRSEIKSNRYLLTIQA